MIPDRNVALNKLIFFRDVAEGKRIHETVNKQCSFSDVSMAPDNSGLIYAVGSDKTIKQFQVRLRDSD